MDLEDIAPGQRFAQIIDNSIERCKAVLVVIGPSWAEILRERAKGPERDWVREEIEMSIARQITVVPVLVGGASMDQLAGLPGKLSVLSEFEAAELNDGTFREDAERLVRSLGLEAAAARPKISWIGGRKASIAAAALGLACVAAVWIGLGPWSQYRARNGMIARTMATGQSQSARGEYESAFRTYQSLLKIDPGNQNAIDEQLNAAMRWLQNFRVVEANGVKVEDVAAALLAEILPVLDAGLARAERTRRAADILAHSGWAHWLNQRIAQREFGRAAERDLREALKIDQSNVFANAMLGSWIMQSGGRTSESLRHFKIADQENREREFVRRLQLGAMIYPRDSDTQSALIQIANEMRRNGETLEDRQKQRILTSYNPGMNTAGQLKVTLSALPPNEAWATYLWLDESKEPTAEQQVRRDYIQASLLEVEGKRQEALRTFEKLRGDLKKRGYDGMITSYVQSAVTRLSKP
jgi:tetratricopeptide (TPR) repeat protein